MKRIVAALLTVFAVSTYANEPWPSDQLEEPRYWETYPTEFTNKMARACVSDYKRLSENDRNLFCICVIWQIENFMPYQKLMSVGTERGQDVVRAANKTCRKLFDN